MAPRSSAERVGLARWRPHQAALLLIAVLVHRIPFARASVSIQSRNGVAANFFPRRAGRADAPVAFTLTMMGSRRGKAGNLKRSLDDTGRRASGVKRINSGRGQEITGVTLPEKGEAVPPGQESGAPFSPSSGCHRFSSFAPILAEGKIRGWAFGEDRTIACANVDGVYYGVEGRCPRCAFDLYRGRLLDDADVWGPDPRVACPTCGTTYSLRTGRVGPDYKDGGLAGFVNTWARTATIDKASRDVPAFVVTADEETGKVYCRER